MISVKPPTSYKDQVEKLRFRGCIIDDEPEAMQILSKVNYYRFTAYFLPFKKPDGLYSQGTNFKTVYRIYEFDRKIRHVIFSAIEEEGHDHAGFISRIDGEKKKRSKEPFVQHHNSKYNGLFPIWAIIELFSFGTLSHFYADLPWGSQKHLARNFFQCHQNDLSSWLHCGTVLRNICAHFGRLYYRKFSVIPNGIQWLDHANNRSLFGAISAIRSLYTDTAKWNKEVFDPIKNLVAEDGGDIQLGHIGFPLGRVPTT